MTDTLYLVFPQTQGSGAAGAEHLAEGAWQVQGLFGNQDFQGIPVAVGESPAADGIHAKADLLTQARATQRLIEAAKPARLVTVGGDCSVDLVPASYLAGRHPDVGVVWLDAHPDLNTPMASPSGRFHGMVLRALLGEGDPDLLGAAFTRLEPYGVFLAGVRQFDPAEYAYFEENRMRLFSANDLETHPERLTELVAARGFGRVHVHLDFDVLSPEVFPHTGYPTPDGLSVNGLLGVLEALKTTFDLVGVTLTEYLPQGEGDEATLQRIISTFGL